MAEREPIPTREQFPFVLEMPTRWRDNDAYGHVNNAVYYTYYENAVMHFLEQRSGLDAEAQGVRFFTVENGCRFHAPVKHPTVLHVGLRVERLGSSSVRYALGIFDRKNNTAAASGFIVDVFVGVDTERPVGIPEAFRRALNSLEVGPSG